MKKLEGSVPRKNVKRYFVYNIIANEVIKPGTVSLTVFLETVANNEVKSKVLFQALAACHAMSCSKMSHNDLHLGNVYVEPLSNPGDESNLIRGWSKKVSRKTGETYYYNKTTILVYLIQ